MSQSFPKLARIAPSIAAADLGRVRDEVQSIEEGGADLIHVDIMDGAFVPNITFGPWILDVVRSVSHLPIDCHLMVSRPRDWISTLAEMGADCITLHIESSPHIHRQIDKIKKLGKRVGISLNPGNPISLIEELLGWVDVVQVMSVDPGFSGQNFLPNALRKVRQLRDLRGAQEYLIKVDGGITSENISSIREAGADVFVLGSFIFSQRDRGAIIRELKEKIQ